MSGPLSDVRVIDLTTMVSGPYCTMTLADQGADVIKIEAPGGDYSRHVATRRGGFSASFVNNNRNKRSVVLNLKRKEAREALFRLLADADVFIQNFRPGVAARMGLGEEAIRAVRPDIITVSIAGFGFNGPFAQKPVFDPLIQALSGLATVQAGSDDVRPRLVRTILPDKLTAIQASQAIAAALYARARHGIGQHIELSMLDTVVAFLWGSDMGGHTFVGDELGQETAQSYIDLIYETADAYVSIALMQDKHWAAFCTVVGRPELITDPRFATPAQREVNKDERTQLTQQLVRDWASGTLLGALDNADVPCAPVLTRRQMTEHDQIKANDLLRYFEHPAAGTLRQTRPAAIFSATPTSLRLPAPALGEHSMQVLFEAGFTDAEFDKLIEIGAVAGSAA